MPVFTRTEFYDLLWSAPASKLAKDLGISDVALGKVAKRYGIPAPQRGYWAKVAAGKRPSQVKLPPRGLGQSDSVTVGRDESSSSHRAAGTNTGVPPLPGPLAAHDETLEDLLTRLMRELGTVAPPKSLAAPHPVVAKMLDIDAKRIEKFTESEYRWSSDHPYYASPFEKRRLRLLSGIFKAVTRTGLSINAKGKDANEFDVFAREGSSISFRLDHPSKTTPRSSYFATSKPDRPASDTLKLEILWHRRGKPPFQIQWQDVKGKLLESHLTEISATLAMAVEASHRHWMTEAHQYAVERHESALKVAEEARLRAIRDKEAEIEAERQARIHKLIADAEAFRLAQDIRGYVAAVIQTNAQSPSPAPPGDIAAWQEAALLCADDLDPVLSKAFLMPASALPVPVAGSTAATPAASTRTGSPTDPAWHPNRFAHFRPNG